MAARLLSPHIIRAVPSPLCFHSHCSVHATVFGGMRSAGIIYETRSAAVMQMTPVLPSPHRVATKTAVRKERLRAAVWVYRDLRKALIDGAPQLELVALARANKTGFTFRELEEYVNDNRRVYEDYQPSIFQLPAPLLLLAIEQGMNALAVLLVQERGFHPSRNAMNQPLMQWALSSTADHRSAHVLGIRVRAQQIRDRVCSFDPPRPAMSLRGVTQLVTLLHTSFRDQFDPDAGLGSSAMAFIFAWYDYDFLTDACIACLHALCDAGSSLTWDEYFWAKRRPGELVGRALHQTTLYEELRGWATGGVPKALVAGKAKLLRVVKVLSLERGAWMKACQAPLATTRPRSLRGGVWNEHTLGDGSKGPTPDVSTQPSALLTAVLADAARVVLADEEASHHIKSEYALMVSLFL